MWWTVFFYIIFYYHSPINKVNIISPLLVFINAERCILCEARYKTDEAFEKQKIIEYGTLRLPQDGFFFLIFLFGIFMKICLHFQILFKMGQK